MRDNQDTMREAAKSVPMADIIHALDLGPIVGGKITSIYRPDERTPSLHIYEYDFFDYATGQGGDQIRFVMDARQISYGQAVRFLASGMGGGVVGRRRNVEPQEKPLVDFTDWSPQPPIDADWQALEELTDKKWPALERKLLGGTDNTHVGRHILYTQHWDPDYQQVVGVKTRSLYTGKKRSLKGSTFTTSLYRPVRTLNPQDARYAILVEGESDAWIVQRVWGKDHPDCVVLALPSGAGAWRDEWFEQLPDKYFVWFDSDEAGRKAYDRHAERQWRHVVPEGEISLDIGDLSAARVHWYIERAVLSRGLVR